MSHAVAGVQKDRATFSYDQLSRMTSETRHINALESYSPNYGDYTMSYGYTLSNALQNVTDSFNSPTNFSYDTVGRTATVTGTFNGTNYTYASNISYRAWGALKSALLGGLTETTSYNNRMSPTHFELSDNTMKYDYAYYDDGKLKQFKDLNDQIGDPHYVQFHYMSRAYSYDQVGRVSGVGQVPNYNVLPPFSGSYGYDVFDNLTSRSGQYALNSNQSDSASYTNNRRGGWSYNAEGQITNSSDNSDSGGSSTRTWTYDAQGALAVSSEVRNGQTTTLALGYDGDGELMNELFNSSTADYFVRSSVLGTALTKLTSTGGKDITYVPTNGLVAAMQYQNPGYTPSVSSTYRDALGVEEGGGSDSSAYDLFGNPIYNVQPPITGPPPYTPFYGATYGGLSWNSFVNANNFSGGCLLNGRPEDCNKLKQCVNEGKCNVGPLDPWTVSPNDPHPLPRYPDGYFQDSHDDYNHGFFNTGPVFGDAEPQNPTLVSQDSWERKHITSDACGHMANVAQQQANKALRTTKNNLGQAVRVFDQTFAKIYVGKAMDGITNVIDLFQNGPQGRTIGDTSPWLGETGFKTEFMDTDPDEVAGHRDADQTHHFGAMFSAGINSTGINWISATVHNFNDNEGDQRLTNAAYGLGSRLASDPKMLRRIGALIRSEICDPKTRGKHL